MKAFFRENRNSAIAGFHYNIINFTAESFPLHCHREVEFFCVTAGEYTILINDVSYLLMPGDIAICGSGDIHSYQTDIKNSAAIILIFDPMILKKITWPDNCSFVLPVIKGNTHLTDIFSYIFHAPNTNDAYNLLITAKIFELCGFCQLLLEKSETKDTKNTKALLNIDKISTVLEYISQDLSNDFDIQTLAKIANMSVGHFCYVFKNTLGVSTSTYINQLKVEQAMILLRETDRSITDICFQCSFETIRSFNRAFKRHTNTTPTQYRLL